MSESELPNPQTDPEDEGAPYPENPHEVLSDVVENDSRYARDAYHFVFEALEHTIQNLGERRHISGQELLQGMEDFAVSEFGRLGRMVLHHWGIRGPVDIGNIVFNLVNANLLRKRDEDSISDFQEGFQVDTMFDIDEPIEWADN